MDKLIIAECWNGNQYQAVLNLECGTIRAYQKSKKGNGWLYIDTFHWGVRDHTLRTNDLPEPVCVELQWRLAQQVRVIDPTCNWVGR